MQSIKGLLEKFRRPTREELGSEFVKKFDYTPESGHTEIPVRYIDDAFIPKPELPPNKPVYPFIYSRQLCLK